ncbi:homeotic protein spalt-major-like isoform X1 [Mya arenaria]|uniref:homeotic protein spalt-major-like isoform X1 n=1 Tax=Mya arenaria TaxID=6604 RepID=UPI0022DFF9EE|nr:homeotic protein spalt-major-like isoform X1 [Mya arenaria]
MGTELENLKEVPGFKAVLRAVIKAQIQLLLQQLSDHADDESLVLTAGVNDGTISQLGSGTGKGFLEGHEEIKSQFLGHCLKTHHSKAPTETRGSPYQRPLDPFSKKNVPKSSKTLAQPPALKNFGEGYNKHTGDKTIAQMLADKTGSASQSNVNMDKGENMVNFDATKVTFDAGLDLNHTQTSCANESEQSDNELKKMDKLGHKLAPDSTLESENLSNPTSIKIEPITENEMELEITGVEPGQPKAPPTQTWPQGPAFTVTTSGGEVDQGEETTDDGSEAYTEAKPSQPASSPPADQIDLTADDDQEDTDQGVVYSYHDNSDGAGTFIVTTVPNIAQSEDPVCNLSIIDVSSLSTSQIEANSFQNPSTLVPSFLYDSSGNITANYSQTQNAAIAVNDVNNPGLTYSSSGYYCVSSAVNLSSGPADEAMSRSWKYSDASSSATWTQQSSSLTQTTYEIEEGEETVIEESYQDPSQPMLESIPINPFKAVKFNKEFYGRSKTRILLKKQICHICNKRLLKKSDLERHIRTHTGERPFRCPACGRNFSQKHNLYLHRRQFRH